MKKLLTALLFTATATSFVNGQTAPQQGVITYDLAIQLRAQVAKKNPALAPMVPEQTHVRIEVAFRNEIFSVVTKEDKSAKGNIQIQNGGGDEKHIVNLKAHTDRTERSFNNRKYYTETSAVPKPAVSYGKETKKIAGYTCNKAVVTTTGKKQYTIWYTTAIPYAYSPQTLDFSMLKGAILQYGNDESTCTATSINIKGFTPASIAADTKARKITEEQMQDLEEDATTNVAKQVAPAQKGQKQTTQSVMIKL